MTNKKEIEREKHLALLANEFFETLSRDDSEYGGWGQDNKRPFGNSFVAGDIAEIIGLELVDYEDDHKKYERQLKYLDGLYDDLGFYLKYKWREFNK